MRRGEKQPLVKEPRSGGPHGFGFQSSLYTRRIGKLGYTFVALLIGQLVSSKVLLGSEIFLLN